MPSKRIVKSRRRRQAAPTFRPSKWLVDPRVKSSRVGAIRDIIETPANAKDDDLAVGLEGVHLSGTQKPDFVFHAPVPHLLMLSFATDCEEKAAKLRRQVFETQIVRADGLSAPRPDRQATAFACIEQQAAAIVFSYMAIEAFVNNSIRFLPEFFTLKGKARDEIEDGVPVADKVKKVLPAAYSVDPLPHGVLSDFADLRKIRRALEHLRASDYYSATSARESTLGALLRGPVVGPRIAAGITQHCVPNMLRSPLRERIIDL